ncbi:MAG: hypothetical protein ACLQOO_35835 [Terriglobia bacterium]
MSVAEEQTLTVLKVTTGSEFLMMSGEQRRMLEETMNDESKKRGALLPYLLPSTSSIRREPSSTREMFLTTNS